MVAGEREHGRTVAHAPFDVDTPPLRCSRDGREESLGHDRRGQAGHHGLRFVAQHRRALAGATLVTRVRPAQRAGARAVAIVAGGVLIQPRIIEMEREQNATTLTAVGPIPQLFRMNIQYRLPAINGLAFDAKVESLSSRYITVNNSRRVSSVVTVDAGVRYITNFSDVPVRLRLQGRNLFNANSVTPRVSGQVLPFEKRRVELSITADF